MVTVEWWLWNSGCGMVAVEWWLWNGGCGMVAVEWWLCQGGTGDCGMVTVELWLWNGGCGMVPAARALEMDWRLTSIPPFQRETCRQIGRCNLPRDAVGAVEACRVRSGNQR